MAVLLLDDNQFSVLLASARLGSQINLVSARFRLSDDHLITLLLELDKTLTGKLILRKADYDVTLLVELRLKFAPKFECI